MTNRPVRIANCSGFYGDRLSAAAQLLDGHDPIDVLTGDWLAELTMSILAKSRARGRAGYATTFVTQMEQVLGRCHERGVKVVSNAGGIDPHGCADRVRAIADQLGFGVTVAVVDGDDITGRLDELLSAGELFRHLDTGAIWSGNVQRRGGGECVPRRSRHHLRAAGWRRRRDHWARRRCRRGVGHRRVVA